MASESRGIQVDPLEHATFSTAVARNGWLFVSGLTAWVPGRGVEHPDDVVRQAEVVYERLGRVLAEAGCSFADVVSTREFITTTEGYRETAAIRRRHFSEPYPAATGVIVAGLLRPGVVFELEAVAALPAAGGTAQGT
jgi:enamine deaminase RidA (YjgF/YER057c/UK114 family)